MNKFYKKQSLLQFTIKKVTLPHIIRKRRKNVLIIDSFKNFILPDFLNILKLKFQFIIK